MEWLSYVISVLLPVGVVVYLIYRWNIRKKRKVGEKEIQERSQVALNKAPLYSIKDDEANKLCDLGATAYEEGDIQEAWEYYSQACALGDSRGLLFTAAGNIEGGSAQAPERVREGFELLLEGAKNLTDSLYPLFYGFAGVTLGFGEKDDPYVDYDLSLALLQKGANLGDPISCYYLGKLYDEEKPNNFLIDYPAIEYDEDKAKLYFEKCAAFFPFVYGCEHSPALLEAQRLDIPRMVAEALINSATFYYFSDDEAERKKAFNYFKLFEQTGIPGAKILLAQCYLEGVGVTGNIKYALQLLQEAIAAGAEPSELYYKLKDEITERTARLSELSRSSKAMNRGVDWEALFETLNEIEHNMQQKREEEEKKEKSGRVEQSYLGTYYFYEDGKTSDGTRLRKFDPETGRGETEDGRKVKNKYAMN